MNNRENTLTEDLFDISDEILSTDNIYERDNWGAVLGMEVLGLRLNNYSLIFSYIEVHEDEEGDTLCDLEEITEIENLLDRAKYFHDCYYDDLPVDYKIESPKDLKNRSSRVCKLLDQHYAPVNDFISTPPSVILPIITKKNTYESGKEWAWFNKTLYLTQTIKKRSLYNSRDEFDNSLFTIFNLLKFDVKKVSLTGYDDRKSLIDNIKESIHIQQVRVIEQAIRSKSSELEAQKEKVNDLEKSLASLNDELGMLRS